MSDLQQEAGTYAVKVLQTPYMQACRPILLFLFLDLPRSHTYLQSHKNIYGSHLREKHKHN